MALRELVLGVCRIARDSAKVEDQVRLLARTLNKTLEPDGPATGCNPVQVGSTPTSVSDHPTADPDYIDFGSRKVSGPELRRRVAVHTQLPAGTTSRLITWCEKHRCLGKPSLGLAFNGRG